MVRSLLPITLITVWALPGCGVLGSGADPEPVPAEVAPAPEPEPVVVEATPEPVAEVEPEPTAEPTALELARAAVDEGRLSAARQAFQTVLSESEPASVERVEALINLGLLQLVLPEEPDLEGARERLQQAEAIAEGTHRLEVSSLIKLLDEIESRDETVRRLTRLIGALRP